MKLIRTGIVLCGMFFGAFTVAIGQSTETNNIQVTKNDSLVHVAYGTVAKKDLPSAISVLNPSSYLDKHYSTYALDGSSAFIGGSNLWNLGSQLVLIDGVPRNEITPAEIDQISFLKGANAVVLYGSRAANGVILITTKRGAEGKFKKSVRVNAGVSVPKSYPDYLGSAEYMKYYNQALKNDGLPSLYDEKTITNYASHSNIYRFPDVNYYSSDYLKKMSSTYSANADFSGGTDKARFYTQVGMERENSLLKFGEGDKENGTRLNLRANVDLKLNDAISTYMNVSTVFYDYRFAKGDYWGQSAVLQPHRFAPLIPISSIAPGATSAQLSADGSRHVIDGQYVLGGTQQFLTNPIADVYAGGYNTYTSRQFQYTGGVDVDLQNAVKGLSAHAQVSVDYSNTYSDVVNNRYAVFAPTWDSKVDSITALSTLNKDYNDGKLYLSGTANQQVIDFNVHADYVNTINQTHNVSAMLVAAGLLRRQTGDYQYRTNSNIGMQLAYNFDHRYYADFTGAIVNSTKLSSDQRIAFSPTFSLGWLLSSESFIKSISAINHLKLAVSAGIVNTDLDFSNYYLYNEMYSSTAYYSWRDGDGKSSSQATTISRSGNSSLGFAKRKEINLGIEGSFFNRALDVQASAFSITKDGMPVQMSSQYPSYFTTGFPVTSFIPYSNYLADRYRGFDFQLAFHHKISDVDLTLGLAGTYVATEAVKRDELFADSYRNRVGKPTDAMFGLQSEGFFSDQNDINSHAVQRFGQVKPGDIKYKDQNGDGVIDERDEVQIGRWNSPFTGGLNFTAQWKDLTLFVLATGYFGGTGLKNNSYYWVYGSSAKYSAVVRNSWTEETKNTASYPRLTTLGGDNNFRASDFWTYSTDQINLSKVQLTYSLPKKALLTSFIDGVKIYVSGSNLLKFSKNKDVMELSVGSAPQARFFNFGIKADF